MNRPPPENVGSSEPSAFRRKTKASAPVGGVKVVPVSQEPPSRILPLASRAMSFTARSRSILLMPDPSVPPGENEGSRAPPEVSRATVPKSWPPADVLPATRILPSG